MKAESHSNKKTFEPIELKITIESQEELDNIRDMGFLNVSIPEAIKERYENADKRIIVNFLNVIREQLNKY